MSEKNYREHELVERYVYDVTRRLNENQRKDIGEELKGLIEDMILEKLSESDMKSDEEVVREVLIKMGNPSKLARQYRGEDEHLIGGEYYEFYCLVLKIVLACSIFGYIVSGIVSIFVAAAEFNSTGTIVTEQVEHFMGLPGVLIGAFGMVTLVFAIMERTKVGVWDAVKWDITKLPNIPAKSNQIKKSDCIGDIVMNVLFLSIFAFAAAFIGVWLSENNRTYCIPIFNLEIWNVVLPVFAISFCIGIIKAVVKLVEGCYNKITFITILLADIASMLIAVILLKGFPIWNPEFIPSLKEVYHINEFSSGDLIIYFGDAVMSNILLCVILVGVGVDIIVTIVKTIRASMK